VAQAGGEREDVQMKQDRPSHEARGTAHRNALPLSLGDCDVHVWTVPLSADTPLDQRLMDVLSASELAAAERFVFADDRRRYALSHAALRLILGTYLGCEAQRIAFARHARDKPYIVGTSTQYSLAHAGDVALVAVGRHHPVGVDLERVRELPDAGALERSCFTARERAHLAAIATDEELLRLWTRKEAVVKATGDGLRRALNDFEVLDPLGLDGWRIVDLVPAAGYVGAAVVRADLKRLEAATFAWRDPPLGN
jgi:4'-phosphopantetheinyl transferase